MNAQQIKSLVQKGEQGRFRVDNNLYLRISSTKKPSWVFRYTWGNSRKELTLGSYGSSTDKLTLRQASDLAAEKRLMLREGINPKLGKERATYFESYRTVNQVASDWLDECEHRLKHPGIPRRVYAKEIAPAIGDLPIDKVAPLQIRDMIRSIRDSERPTIANDALGYCKQLFNHAMKLGLVTHNPALAFTVKDAGGIEKSRERVLSKNELQLAFSAMLHHQTQFVRENYLACILLVCLGVRKFELLSAPWSEFDLAQGTWRLPKERSKNGIAITYPLHPQLVEVLFELKILACGADYVFPNRRNSQRFPHISPDTLNAALSKMFKQDKISVEHFTLHDLRRTFRTHLASLKVAPHIAERCLNHKLPGIMATYDQFDYFEERKAAHSKLVEHLWSAFCFKTPLEEKR
ncbi:tyrosine-type recombinase/integrase [Pseudoalteromonas sp. T1lg75]|uniref:tyrosine-type recombinase/integrase n=1 Tax=Pseudoalteromonas sp. T1lg75 TaxID=2077102 RepID=UPI000CF6F3AA|nr:site-specific integrase [Pseudoalteromonas sp. T1lg75]